VASIKVSFSDTQTYELKKKTVGLVVLMRFFTLGTRWKDFLLMQFVDMQNTLYSMGLSIRKGGVLKLQVPSCPTGKSVVSGEGRKKKGPKIWHVVYGWPLRYFRRLERLFKTFEA